MSSVQIYAFLRTLLVWGVGIFVCVVVVRGTVPVASAADQALPQEALVDLVKPSVVRIAQHVSGTAKIPHIKVDILKHLVAVVPNAFTEVPVDEYLVGSGFVIHPDGYIATNSHVVSEQTAKEMMASDSALAALYENALFLSDVEMQSFLQTETANSFSRQVLQFVITQSVFELKSEVAVLRPASLKKSIPDLLADGFPATVIAVNDNFSEDEMDVALIKINESRLPALALGEGGAITVGKKAFIFGFPATAEPNQNHSLEATFTQGVVSAIKQSTDKSFKLFQTDAKVSEGSSGGPLFDEYGAVVGIVTFQTDELNRSQGDNFAFALPIEMIRDAARKAGVPLSEGQYGDNFKKGFLYFSEKQCTKAESAFRAALEGNNGTFVTENGLGAYFQKCDAWQKAGTALNTRFDRIKASVRALGDPFFYLAGVGLLFVGFFGGALYWVLRQVQREEREIAVLETRLRADEHLLKRYESGSVKKEKKIL
ncbi:MAG: serine protease [Candidatus Moraniibacteriota bacterium]